MPSYYLLYNKRVWNFASVVMDTYNGNETTKCVDNNLIYLHVCGVTFAISRIWCHFRTNNFVCSPQHKQTCLLINESQDSMTNGSTLFAQLSINKPVYWLTNHETRWQTIAGPVTIVKPRSILEEIWLCFALDV